MSVAGSIGELVKEFLADVRGKVVNRDVAGVGYKFCYV